MAWLGPSRLVRSRLPAESRLWRGSGRGGQGKGGRVGAYPAWKPKPWLHIRLLIGEPGTGTANYRKLRSAGGAGPKAKGTPSPLELTPPRRAPGSFWQRPGLGHWWGGAGRSLSAEPCCGLRGDRKEEWGRTPKNATFIVSGLSPLTAFGLPSRLGSLLLFSKENN